MFSTKVGLRCCYFHVLLPADDDSTGGHSGGGRDSRILFRYQFLPFVCCRSFLYLCMSSSAGIKDQSQNLGICQCKTSCMLKNDIVIFIVTGVYLCSPWISIFPVHSIDVHVAYDIFSWKLTCGIMGN